MSLIRCSSWKTCYWKYLIICPRKWNRTVITSPLRSTETLSIVLAKSIHTRSTIIKTCYLSTIRIIECIRGLVAVNLWTNIITIFIGRTILIWITLREIALISILTILSEETKKTLTTFILYINRLLRAMSWIQDYS